LGAKITALTLEKQSIENHSAVFSCLLKGGVLLNKVREGLSGSAANLVSEQQKLQEMDSVFQQTCTALIKLST
jgi:hypothetical protein